MTPLQEESKKPKFEKAVTVIPADWANAVDALVFNAFNQARTLDEVKMALGLGTLAFVNSKNPAILNAVLTKPSITGGTARFDAVTTRHPIREQDAATKQYVDNAAEQLKDLVKSSIQKTGDLVNQNANNVRISGGMMDAVTLGSKYPCVGVFSHLNVTTIPTEGSHVVNLAYLSEQIAAMNRNLSSMATQSHTAVEIRGGTIDGTEIGKTEQRDAWFNRVKVMRKPLEGNDVITKAYFEDVMSKSVNAVRSMATQDANAVDISGGNINNTAIGLTNAAEALFTTAGVKGTADIPATFRVVADPTKDVAGRILFGGTAIDLGTIKVLGNSNAQYPNGMVVEGKQSVALQSGGGYGVVAKGEELVLFTPAANLITITEQKVRIGGGSFSDATLTINAKTAAADMSVKRLTNVGSLLHAADLSASAAILTDHTEMNTAETGGAYVKLDRNTSFSFRPSPEDANQMRHFRMIVEVKKSGVVVNWPSTVKWVGGSAPRFNSSQVNSIEVLDFTTVDGGASWVGVKL